MRRRQRQAEEGAFGWPRKAFGWPSVGFAGFPARHRKALGPADSLRSPGEATPRDSTVDAFFWGKMVVGVRTWCYSSPGLALSECKVMRLPICRMLSFLLLTLDVQLGSRIPGLQCPPSQEVRLGIRPKTR